MIAPPRLLSFAELDARSAEFDAAVARSPDVDLFCSSSDWILPARAAFARSARPAILEVPGAGFVALMSVPLVEGGHALLPLEASWGLASPFVGALPEVLVEGLYRLMESPTPPGSALFLSGVRPDGRAYRALLRPRRHLWRLGLAGTAGRHAADLTGGMDAFMARRSAKFRANLRREQRLAVREGVTYQYLTSLTGPETLAAWHRIQAIEVRSWKGMAGHGIDQPPGYSFYRRMVLRLAARGALRVVFARLGGVDIAYVFGGLFGPTYRGLQCSFAEEHRALAPGVLVHAEMIERLCAGGVSLYDLGSEMEYKRRWGEPGLETVTVAVMRGG